MKTTLLDSFDSKKKAIDHALWLNFKYRIANIKFGVIHGKKNDWAVCEEVTAKEIGITFLDILPKGHQKLMYAHIRHIKMDRDLLPHWEKIMGIIATTDGEILRYILHSKIPLEKLIRFELADRGYDKNHRWCGFEKAYKIWIKEEI